MAPILDDLLIPSSLPSIPAEKYAQQSLLGSVPTCGQDDTKLQQILVNAAETSVYLPKSKDVSPRTTFHNIDDSLLRKILSAKDGFQYEKADKKGQPTGGTGVLHLCRGTSPVSGSGAAARYELFVANNPILENAPKQGGMDQLTGIRLSDLEIVNLVRGSGLLDSSQYGVSQDSPGMFLIVHNRALVSKLANWLENDAKAHTLFPNSARREEILEAIKKNVEADEFQFAGIRWSATWQPTLAGIGALAGIAGIGATIYMSYQMRKQAKEQSDMLDGKTELTPEKIKQIFDGVSRNVTTEAREGKIDEVLGRDLEIAQVLQILEANELSGANIPSLIGEKGVGKTAIAEGIALAIIQGKLPQYEGWEVVEIVVPDLTAGTGIRGAFENKMKAVIASMKNSNKKIYFMDEVHLIIGAGKTEGSATDAAQMLKTIMARPGLLLITGTTAEEYKLHVTKDAAFESRLTPVMVNPVDAVTRTTILKGVRESFLKKISRLEEAKGKTPSQITIPDEVLDHLGHQMGTNTREIKKTLALVVTRVRLLNPKETRITLSVADVDAVIEQRNETRRALDQAEFGKNAPAVKASVPANNASVDIMTLPIDNTTIENALRHVDPTMADYYRTNIANASAPVGTFMDLAKKIAAIDPAISREAFQSLTASGLTPQKAPERFVFEVISRLAERDGSASAPADRAARAAAFEATVRGGGSASSSAAPAIDLNGFLDRIGLDALELANVEPGELAEAVVLRLATLNAPASLQQELVLLDKMMTKNPTLFPDRDECVRTVLTARIGESAAKGGAMKSTVEILNEYAKAKGLGVQEKARLADAAKIIDRNVEKAREEEREKRARERK